MIRLLVISFVTFLVFSFIHYLGKNKKPCKRAFLSLLWGPLVLIAVNVLSSVTNVLVPISELSLMTSIAGGIPGVALLVLSTVLL
ncbi:MAG: pro-sigmaK processing inhibitor BofA family protein [Ruminococcus sp.]|nr:pro-sigmaK processing inhibitor BofA family protein [Ruminococcus sp.]MBQ7133715.1 pro-sigmaK processing inhibitor BofA family protein [Ruminococcus sp.]